MKTVTVVLLVLLAASIEHNWVSYRAQQQNDQLLVNYGIGEAWSGLYGVDRYLSGHNANHYDKADIINLISNAAGHLEAIQANLQRMNVNHIGGIGKELDGVATLLSHPDKYISTKIIPYERFVHVVVIQLKTTQDAHGNVMKNKLQMAIEKIYQYMPTQDRQTLYNW